jgi:CDP-diacylglycerol--glycerol-3-phosphate 3-phosphatidyltransferase/cardiolipin synthase
MICLKIKIKKSRQSIPYIVTSLRLVVLPFLIYAFFLDIKIIVYFLFVFSIGTDLVDGFVARKLGVSSQRGAIFDAIADFLFIYGLFAAFMIKGFYPTWIFLLLIFVFELFILTNLYSKRTIYDPVGKYLGSLLFGGIGLTLLFSFQLVYDIVTIGIVFSTAVSILSRSAYFLLKDPEQR